MGSRASDAASLVREIVGVQAQEPLAGAWSIGVRCSGVDAADVARALFEERSIVRIWAMRGTLHYVAAEDAAWLTELLAPVALPGVERRLTQLGVPEKDRPRAIEAICAALGEHGPLTRVELMGHVAAVGVETAGQAGAHLPGLAALHGLVCFGEPRGGKPTYALRADWLAQRPLRLHESRSDALLELASRYLRAYGPAEPEDFAAWSGLPLRDARAAWPAEADESDANEPDPPDVRLLPAFDTYLLGYRSRDFIVPPEHARRVAPGGGIIRPVVVANGRAVGTWRRRGSEPEVEPFPGARIPERPLGDAIAAFQRFSRD